MQFVNEDIKYSRKDILRKIKLPKNLTPKLAEIMGIIIGDGHLDHHKKYRTTTMYSVCIGGSSAEDMDYYKNKINPLFFKLFNLKFTFLFRRNDELILRLYSKAITTFIKNLGIKAGNKLFNNHVPNIILISDDEIKKSFLRGLFDTDGYLSFKKDYKGFHSKPIISITMKSKILADQVRELLEFFELNPHLSFRKDYYEKRKKTYVRYRIEMAGKKTLKNFLELIGFRNPKHLTKIKIWKRFGFYPPRLSYRQRLEILRGKVDPHIFYQ